MQYIYGTSGTGDADTYTPWTNCRIVDRGAWIPIDTGLLMYKAWITIEEWWHFLFCYDLRNNCRPTPGRQPQILKHKTLHTTRAKRRNMWGGHK